MIRLAQFGVFLVMVGGVVLFLGLFPFAADIDATPGVGIAQILGILAGLFVLVTGAYVMVYALVHRGSPTTLLRDVGVRLGMTGLVFATAATLADLMGFGSHTGSGGFLFGWLQATGMLVGFVIAAIGVLIYGIAR